MKNPFEEFQPASRPRRRHEAETFHYRNEAVIRRWTGHYRDLLAGEIDNLYWETTPEHLATVYGGIVAGIRGLDFSAHEIEAFYARLLQSDPLPLHLPGPLGLFLSALVNGCRDRRITFFSGGTRRPVHFLGYRLPAGKSLFVDGPAGDFTGAGLNGGRLEVDGAVGGWCGAGMLDGAIVVRGNAGPHLGRWMHGGSIQVRATVAGIGEPRYGGRVTCDEPSGAAP